MSSTQKTKAIDFLKLHHAEKILVLPNGWDVATACVFENAGFPAIGTTSAGIAVSLGYPDGDKIPKEEMIEAISRITQKVAVPVTADIENGYSNNPKEIYKTILAVIKTGAVGVNIEDGTNNPQKPLNEIEMQVEKIKAARKAADDSGIPLVINIRTDTYWLGIGEEENRLQNTIQRLLAYQEAGADCLFIPGVKDAKTITQLVKSVNKPINILGGIGAPSTQELQRLGVARVSVGSGPMRASLTLVEQIAKELQEQGTYTFTDKTISYNELNKLIS